MLYQHVNPFHASSAAVQTTLKKIPAFATNSRACTGNGSFAQVEHQFPVLPEGTENVNHSQGLFLFHLFPLELYSKIVSLLQKKNTSTFMERILALMIFPCSDPYQNYWQTYNSVYFAFDCCIAYQERQGSRLARISQLPTENEQWV